MVKIYTTPVCVYCKMAKEFFKKHNVAYVEVDVTTDDSLVEEMVQKSHQMGVPVIEIDGEIFVGFDREGISRALKIS
ncbi:MAG: NrdH-redoxin [Candidatus Colwellbacteria bacterium RIFCSPHIGHO2_12_FULL_43_12]|uniref:NrdH-redoxin n=2 Tax=Candidatus Colwelliibacteriota TaxID=1817904 RepID=A0A1G1Z142_9BACT|nr:MAG: NrdH-redoxin [Candidatus Colwellbacteria bacterium RIFCSPHIGHO2_12_FULL_43_12]OGY60613.1 MAG: NrdH-redoxin [Candidatus Colwellbacteria bacterium RIFCSPLOWO2_12_FULL_43_11]